jgi:hypothetical protein
MMKNTKINIAELEFDDIKQNIKNFLQGQDRFSDYDFEGSNMSVLLDVLAYNTHYNIMYTNMAVNEVYLDSAYKRNSVVSIAKTIGYLPRSATCSKLIADIVVSGTISNPAFLTLPKLSPFGGTKDGIRYSFYTTEDLTVARSDTNTYTFSDMVLIAGENARNTFRYSQSNSYALSNANIDLSTLKVLVQPSPSSSTFDVYRNGNTMADIDGEDLVYFIKEVDNGFYELSFGDNIIGKSLNEGNIINIEYFVSYGDESNGIRSIQYSGATLFGGSVSEITVTQSSSGGRLPEDTDSIRSNAPSFWQSQNRAVTESDYKSILLATVPELQDVYVWGGEKNTPPVYGKVFISASTTSEIPLTDTQKTLITKSVLDKYKVVTVIPEIVNPEYINIELDVVAYYDQTKTSSSASDIATTIISEYDIYNNEVLRRFNSVLRNSDIIQIAEDSNRAIVNVVPRMKIQATLNPFLGTAFNYEIRFGNPLVNRASTITSSFFFTSDTTEAVYIENTLEGDINLVTVAAPKRTIKSNIGKVDYNKGIIRLQNILVTNLFNESITITAIPSTSDIVSSGNIIAKMDISKLKVNVIADNGNNKNYQFTSNRL